jgi:Arc/MetJ-type ribon-helix-helix transcriptional regulator
MQISIPPQVQKLVEDRVRSGQYARPEDVVAAAILSLEQQERASTLTRPELEALYPGLTTKLAEGLAAADAGQLSDGDDFFDELEREEAAGRANDRRIA